MNEMLNSFGRLGRYAALVLVPTALVVIYLTVFAADGYVSRAEVMVENDSPASAPELALGLLAMGSSRNKADALVVKTFMESRAMLGHLDQLLDLRGHFTSPSADRLGRLSPKATAEEFLDHYRRRLQVKVDEESYIIGIEFVAYDPEFAQRVTQALIARSEEFVNDVSRYLAREQLRFVQVEVERAHERLKHASREIIALQREYQVFSPEHESEAAGTIIGALMQELTRKRTELRNLESFMNPAAPEVIAIRQQVAALEAQLAQERHKLVGGSEDGLNALMLDYQDAEMNLKLATEVYKSAMGSMEAARLDTARNVKYLVSVSRPSLPDAAERPRIGYWTVTVFLLLNLLFFVVGLITATIQDHSE